MPHQAHPTYPQVYQQYQSAGQAAYYPQTQPQYPGMGATSYAGQYVGSYPGQWNGCT